MTIQDPRLQNEEQPFKEIRYKKLPVIRNNNVMREIIKETLSKHKA